MIFSCLGGSESGRSVAFSGLTYDGSCTAYKFYAASFIEASSWSLRVDFRFGSANFPAFGSVGWALASAISARDCYETICTIRFSAASPLSNERKSAFPG